jgi:2-C-methyl-D-erythritol 2,4-cyclodiphosphate synthase
MSHRVGFGYDVHRFEKNRPFTLGGIIIPHNKGLAGHSDADVLIHAICDALLGAASLGDIGSHFPDSSVEYKNIDSKLLLKEVVKMVSKKNFRIGNIDTTISLQKPQIATYIPQMIQTLATVMEIDEADISVKATTTERMGFVGREEGVAAYAVVLIERS